MPCRFATGFSPKSQNFNLTKYNNAVRLISSKIFVNNLKMLKLSKLLKVTIRIIRFDHLKEFLESYIS